MFTRTKFTSLLVTLFFAASAVADPVTIDLYPNEEIPGTLGGYETDAFSIDGETTALNPDGTVASFTNDGNEITLEGDPVTIASPDWAVPDGSSIFVVHGSTVTLNPATPLGAISFIITASFSGSAWVSADWSDGSGSGTVFNPNQGNYFAINQTDDNSNNAIGVGIYAEPGACITSVTVDPIFWGMSSISTANCIAVPEPGSLSLLSLGLLSLGLLARRRNRIV